MTAQEQLDKNSARFTWKNFSEASVHKAKLHQAPAASGTACTQRLPRSRSCPFSAQGLGIWSNCSSQPPDYLSKLSFSTYFFELSCTYLINISWNCLKLY